MRILLVDADSQKGFPNLALMKLSKNCKDFGNTVSLIKGIPESGALLDYEQVYISCIFEKNAEKVKRFAASLNCDYVGMGGTGLDIGIKLNENIEHLMPDYDLYNIDFSMGFTSRGCINKCPFCVVPIKEGQIRDHAPLSEFLHPDHDKLILLDNNFLASPKWKENLEIIIDDKLQVNFNQGLDIRLINQENASMLANTKYSTWKFNTKRISFAFDHPSLISKVENGINILLDNGISKSSLMFYILVGYNTTIQQDLQRIDYLLKLGIEPYVMRYNQTLGNNRILMHLSRFINNRVYRRKNIDFYHYDYSDSQEAIKKVFGENYESS